MKRLVHRLQGCVTSDVAVDVIVVGETITATGGPPCVQRALVDRPCVIDDGRYSVHLSP